MKKLVLLLTLIPVISFSQVGVNTTDPRTTLDVNGAITNREVSFTVASNAVNIATETSLANLTGAATASITVTSFTPTVNGCRLIVSNNTTGGFGATFAGITIPNNQSIEFVYTNGAWKSTLGGTGTGTNIYNANGTITNNRIVSQTDKTLAFTSTATTGTSHFTVDGSTFNVDAVNNRVGIGTATPTTTLDVGGNFKIYGNALGDFSGAELRPHVNSGSFTVYSGVVGSGTPRFTVTNAGNVGIGILNPSAQFHTTGSVMFTGAGTPALNKVLVSDATGLATWQKQTAANTDSNAIAGSSTSIAVPSTNVQGAISDLATAIKSNASVNDWNLDGNNNGVIKKIGTKDGFDLPFITSNTERMRILSSGNVGIGTTSPFAKFQVNVGSATDGLVVSSGATWDGIGFAHDAATGYINAGGVENGIAFRTNTSASGTFTTNPFTEQMRILANGNVGIGTASPATKLDVAAGTTTTNTVVNAKGSINDFLQFNVQNTSTGTQAQSGYSATADNGSATTGFAWMGINNSTFNYPTAYNIGLANDVSFVGSGQDLYLANANNTKSIIFSTGKSTTPFFNERMRITNAGNVGIGTSTPIGKLNVAGGLVIGSGTNSALTAGIPFTFGNTTNSALWFGHYDNTISTDYGVMYLQQSPTDVATLNIVVGDNANGGASDDSVFIGNVEFSSGTKKGVTIKNGFTGIGTIAPTAQLHTTGSVLFAGAGTPVLGRSLVTDATGLATWQNPLASNSTSTAIAASATQVAVPATNVQGAISDLATAIKTVSANDWKLDGNTNGAINKFGTIDGFDVPFITSNVERMRILSNGNIGIGTTTAPHKLTISGNLPLGVDNGSTFQSKNASGTYENFLWPRWSDNIMYLNYGASGFNIRNNSSVTTMFMTNAGNIGIGTTTPNAALQFANTIANRRIVLWEAANNDHQFFGFGINNNVLRYQVNTASDSHVFYAGSSATTSNELMRIQGNGNVGIGSINPTKKLTVENGSIRPAVGNSQDAGVYFPTDIGGGGGDEAFIRYYVESGENTKLMIGVNNDADDDISFYQGGAERMNIYNGNVGIGTTTPVAKLDTTGLKATGAGVGTGGSSDAASQAIIPAGNNGTSRLNDWPAGWGGGLSTFDIVGASTFMNGYLTRSDFRLKNDIKSVDNSIFSNFMKIRPVTYFMKEQTKETEGLQYGFIAQEIRDLFPSMVTKSDDPNGIIGMNYQALISPTIYVVQQQQAKIDELQKQVDSQNEKLSKMEEELKQIKQLLSK